MKEVIAKRRKELGMTQEQVARYLGVSAPAVNKWERGITFPDVTILPVLARLLEIDLNTLFDFYEGPSKAEIVKIIGDVFGEAETKGFEATVEKVKEIVKRYPKCAKLIQNLANGMKGLLIFQVFDETEKEQYESWIHSLYEQVLTCDDTNVKYHAMFMLASEYIQSGDYEKAQKILDELPQYDEIDKRQLQIQLYLKKEQYQEVEKILHIQLMSEIASIVNQLCILAEIAIEKDEDERADRIASVATKVADAFELWDYYKYVVKMSVAIKKQDVKASIEMIKNILNALSSDYQIGMNAIFGQTQERDKNVNFGHKMLPALLHHLQQDESTLFLQNNEEFIEIMKQYEMK